MSETMSGKKRFFGWSVAWAAFALAVFAWGIGFYGPSVFLQVLHTHADGPSRKYPLPLHSISCSVLLSLRICRRSIAGSELPERRQAALS
jgi:hypothetical protein